MICLAQTQTVTLRVEVTGNLKAVFSETKRESGGREAIQSVTTKEERDKEQHAQLVPPGVTSALWVGLKPPCIPGRN